MDVQVRETISSVKRTLEEDIWKSSPFGRRTLLKGLAVVYTANVDFTSFEIEISVAVASPKPAAGVVGVFGYDTSGELIEIAEIVSAQKEHWSSASGGIFEFAIRSPFRTILSGRVRPSVQTLLVYCKASAEGDAWVRCALLRNMGEALRERVVLGTDTPPPRPVPSSIVSAFQSLPAESRLAVMESAAIGLFTARQDLREWIRDGESPRAEMSALAEGIKKAYDDLGLHAALRFAYAYASDGTALRKLLEGLADELAQSNRRASLILCWCAHLANPNTASAKKSAARLFKQGNISSASAMLESVGTQQLTRYLSEIALAAELKRGFSIPPRKRPTARRVSSIQQDLRLRIAYVAAGALPILSAGYSVRTHQILLALSKSDVHVTCFLRPGFPWDRPDLSERVTQMSQTGVFEVGATACDRHAIYDHIDYRYSTTTPIEDAPREYLAKSSAVLEGAIGIERYSIVHAASNYRNALPALLAARRLGVPFIYEVRGLWELTAASKIAGWEETERFELDRNMEALVAREADHVITITGAVADELANFGVDRNLISVVPNAVDEHAFYVRPKDAELAARMGLAEDMTLVYCGSLVSYEGLDDVIAAVGLLRDEGMRVQFVIVGDGAYRATLERLTVRLHLQDRITFVGNVAAGDVSAYWSLADIVPIMRKNLRVCQVVSPLKPFEAMAMGKVVIASDLYALREIVYDGENGRLCSPERPDQISEILRELAGDREQRVRLGAAARNWIVNSHTWHHNAKRLAEIYHDTLREVGKH